MMNGSALHCWFALAMLFLHPRLNLAHPVAGSPSGSEIQSLEDLLERLEEKFQQGELEIPNYEADAADLGDSEAHPPGLLDLLPPIQPSEVEAQLRDLLASPKRRRHFSGCFGTRLERIGTQTGLGCKIYKARSRRKTRS